MALAFSQTSTDTNNRDALQFFVDQSIRDINTVLPCKIKAVDNVNFLYDVELLINYLDTSGTPITPPILYNVPYCNISGGNAGIIIQPNINDVVLVGFIQRDSTVFKRTKGKASNPPTRRIYDLADAIIISTIRFADPTIYVKITPDIIEIKKGDTKISLDGTTLTAENASSKTILTSSSTTLEYGTTNSVVLNNTSNTATFGSNSVAINATGTTITGNLIVTGTINSGAIVSSGLISGTDLAVTGKPNYSVHTHPAGLLKSPSGAVTGDTGAIL